ncbi:TolB-like protein [Pseudorhodoplanes sinuspersici]|nr:TolB-like protein [Pseudorhodoplanes sinuspersici]
MLEPGRGRLLGRDGAEISLRPKAFELLVALTEAGGRPLKKTELLDRVWGKTHVTEDSLFQAVKDARRALDDREGRLLRYMPRRGYVLDCTLNTDRPGKVAPEPALSIDRPSVAVLPFRTLGEDTSTYLAAGLTEEISIALSRFRWLFVLANASAMAIAAQTGSANAEILEAARNLGIRYLVEGSLARTERQIVVRCRLVETATGRQVWQERFTRDSVDVLDLYEAITSAIAAAIEPRLLRAEVERVLRRGTSNLDAFDSYLRALPGYYSRTPHGNSEAIALLEAAIARDPHFALATALLARCVATSVWLGTEPDFASGTARALALARAALNIDRSDSQVLALCGHLLVIVGGEHAEGGALVDLSLRMNPNSAEAWRLGGWVSAWGGETELALHRLAEAERLDPLSPLQSDVHSARSVALLMAQRFSEAVEAARRSIATTPEATTPRRFLIAALWHAGAREEARQECAAMLQRQPNASLRRGRWLQVMRHSWMADLVTEGLRGAGVPE